MRVLVIAKDSMRFRELPRRSQLLRHSFTYAASPKKVGEMSPADFDVVLDYRDSYDSRRYTAIREAVRDLFTAHEVEWLTDADDLPHKKVRL